MSAREPGSGGVSYCGVQLPSRPVQPRFVETYAMVLPSWLQLGAAASCGSPLRASVPLAAAGVVASKSTHERTMFEVLLLLSNEVIARRSPVAQWAGEKVKRQTFHRASACVPPDFRNAGPEPTVPAVWSMSARPPAHCWVGVPTAVAVVVNAANSPSGVDVWQPTHWLVACCAWAYWGGGSTVAAPPAPRGEPLSTELSGVASFVGQ